MKKTENRQEERPLVGMDIQCHIKNVEKRKTSQSP